MVVTRRAAAAMKNNNKPEKTNDTITNTVTTRKRSTKTKKAQSSPPPQPEEESDQDDDLKDTTTTTIKSISEPVVENGSDQANNSSDSHNSSDDNDVDSANEANDSDNDSNSGEEDSASSDDDDDEQQETSSEDEDQDDDDDDDDDLDDLLNKAQTALRKQQDGVIKLDADDEKKSLNLQFPKLQPGVSVDDELYIKDNKMGIAKLSPQAVTVVDSDDSTSKNTKTLVALTKIKQDIKPPSRKERQLERAKTTGKGWFDMPLADVTPEIKRDLQILRMRHVLDRKRHYKKMGKGPDPKYFQMGTVIEGATEFFSSRINKKDRKRTFAEEILSQDDHTDYYNRKYQESQERKSSGGKKHFKKLKAKRS